jgi:hypothetical protein
MRRTLPLVLAVLILAWVALGLVALPHLRRERLALTRLQNHMERAAAPDEPVLTDDRWLALAMRWLGSRAASHPVSLVRGEGDVDALLHGREGVLVARPEDALLQWLQAAGYRLTPDTDAASWDEAGEGSALCGHASVRIFFVLPPRAAGTIPSKP